MTGAGALIVFVTFAHAAAAPSAAASDSASPAAAKARAQALLRDGTALFEAGNYAGALEKFEAALAAFPSPKILFNIGEANRNLLRYVEALQAFEEFLARALDAPAQSIGDARGFVAELKAKLGRIQIECRVAGAEVSVDGKRAGMTPLPAPVWAMPGRRQIAVRHPDHVPAIEDVDVAAGALRALAVDLRPLAPAIDLAASRPAPPDPGGAGLVPSAGESESNASSERSITRRWWFWTLIGAAALLAAAGGIWMATASGGSDTPRTTLGSQPARPVSF